MSKYVPNSFQVANAFVDEAMSKISDASVKIYLIINRKTRGWAKECDALSITQLEELSGKSHPTVVRCTKELIKVGLVKKHEQSVYGNVYSLIDNYFVGEYINFPNKSSVLIQTFSLFNGQLVKNFNYQKPVPKKSTKGKKSKNLCLNFPQKTRLLVKNFNHLEKGRQLNFLTTASKNFLPLLVKIFNTQNTLSKPTYQNKKNTWFVLENLKFEICSINPSVDTDEIFKASNLEGFRILLILDTMIYPMALLSLNLNHKPKRLKIFLQKIWKLDLMTMRLRSKLHLVELLTFLERKRFSIVM